MSDPKYKARLRIPTEMYAYIEVDVEDTPEGILEAYRGFVALTKVGVGLPPKEMNAFIDSYLLGEMNGLGEVYEKMSESQKDVAQTIKRSLARIKARELKANNE